MAQQPLQEELCNGYAASLVSAPCGECPGGAYAEAPSGAV
jgi:hypothetical protein